MNHPVFRSQHNGGASGQGQAIQSDVRRNHGWRRILVEVTPPQPFQRRPLGFRRTSGFVLTGKPEVKKAQTDLEPVIPTCDLYL